MSAAPDRVVAVYHVRSEASSIEARATAIAVEQSVEISPALITDPFVLRDVVGRVDSISQLGRGLFEVRISLHAATFESDAGQMMNMLFGNTSLHEDVTLEDVVFPPGLLAEVPGPRYGIAGLRRLVGAGPRALTASVLKPQGLPPRELARLAGALATGGIDIVKDDHGIGDPPFSRFKDRVRACADAVAEGAAKGGHISLYAPYLSGNLDQLRAQLDLLRTCKLSAALVAPMVMGLASFETIAREADGIALLAHPSMAGAARLSPPLLLGRIFRMLGADATIFPNHGGRFSYSPDTCRRIAEAARGTLAAMPAAAPMPAGGMTLDRTAEMLGFYGPDTILLIGGGLLAAGDRVAQETRAFVDKVCRHVW